MALPSTGQISLQDILFEKQGSTTARTDVSLKGLSVDGTADYGTFDISGTPNGTAPYGISEFHGWSSNLTSGNLTNGYDAGTQYVPAYSGYAEGSEGYGSWTGSDFTYDGDTVNMSYAANISNYIHVTFKRTDSSTGTFNNSGWTNFNIYLNQTNNSGSPDLTLARTSASIVTTGSSYSAITWSWGPDSSYAISSYFGTTSGNVHHLEFL
jgi:hypothetical protein